MDDCDKDLWITNIVIDVTYYGVVIKENHEIYIYHEEI